MTHVLRPRVLFLVLAALVVSLLVVAPSTDAAPESTAEPAAAVPKGQPSKAYVERDGKSAPVYSYKDAIRESVWVEAPDFDEDGKADRVAVDIVRPAELNGEADVPVIMDASPYFSCCGRGNESELKTYDADGNVKQMPLFYDNYFVPRGYAFVGVDMAGTNRSTGCTDQGGDSDIGSVKAVVQWLNGNAKAFDADGNPVDATWTNGRTGMIGKSYDGTLANGVAGTGVKGLETIVPVAGISAWYDYTRSQGLPYSYDYPTYLSEYVGQERTEKIDCQPKLDEMAENDGDESGKNTAFWRERDYRAAPGSKVDNIKASVFLMHGLQDLNVQTKNFSRFWKELGERTDVDRKMFLTRLGHVDPFDTNRRRWVDTLHRWFDHELMGIDNDILDEPAVSAEIAPNKWVDSAKWPVAKQTTLRPRANGRLVKGPKHAGRMSFVNKPGQTEAQTVSTDDNPNRLLYMTAPLRKSTRISGSPVADVTIRNRVKTGQVSVALVDYGPAKRVLETGDGAKNLKTESCAGKSTSYDDACFLDVARRIKRTPLQVIARGWARLDGASTHTVPVKLAANDLRVAEGHRLGLVVSAASNDWLETVDKTASKYTTLLRDTALHLPGKVKFARDSAGKRTLANLAPLSSFVPGTVPTAEDIRELRRLG